jgi:hypothetical protein
MTVFNLSNVIEKFEEAKNIHLELKTESRLNNNVNTLRSITPNVKKSAFYTQPQKGNLTPYPQQKTKGGIQILP